MGIDRNRLVMAGHRRLAEDRLDLDMDLRVGAIELGLVERIPGRPGRPSPVLQRRGDEGLDVQETPRRRRCRGTKRPGGILTLGQRKGLHRERSRGP